MHPQIERGSLSESVHREFGGRIGAQIPERSLTRDGRGSDEPSPATLRDHSGACVLEAEEDAAHVDGEHGIPQRLVDCQ